MRGVLFTRSGRPSGAQMAWRLAASGFIPVAVLVEKRWRMVKGDQKSVFSFFRRVGPVFVWKRIWENFQIKSHYWLRKYFGKRFKDPSFLSIEEWALDYPSIPLYYVKDHNSAGTQTLLRQLNPDIGVLTNTRRIKKEILSIPRYGFLNLHLSALPKYAGLDSIFWALYHGEKEIGVTIHFASDEIDRGDIVLQRKIRVSSLDDQTSLYEKALWLGTHLMTVALKKLQEDTLERTPQDKEQASYFSWPSPKKLKIFDRNWKKERKKLTLPSENYSILHVITRMTRGGAQENTLATVQGLSKRGYQVTLLTGPSFGNEGEILSQALEEGLEVVILPELVREVSFWKDLIAYQKLRSWLAQRHYAIIHTHTSKAGFLGRVSAYFSSPSSILIHTPHGHVFHSYFKPLKEKLFLVLERLTARWTDCLIALTERCRREHLELKVGIPEQWVTIPSGVEEKFFQDIGSREELLNSLGISPERKIIGFIGRLAPVKGAAYLIEALPEIFQEIPEAHCLIVGEGEEKLRLEKRVEEWELKHRVTFAGHQKNPAPYLSAFDVLVVPSLNEGMGRVIVEGGLLCKPVVGTNIGGIPDLIEPQETGLLVEPKNPSQIAKAVMQLLQDPLRCKRLGMTLRAKVLNGFTADQMLDKIDSLYQKLLMEKGIQKEPVMAMAKEEIS